MASTAPERSAGIPESCVWSASLGRWELSQKNEQGAREGECLLYRPDGSLASRFRFAADVQNGPFAIYHPDGQVARAGTFAAGRIEGVMSSYASAAPGNEPLRACCVPPTATRLEGLYQDGQLVQEIFYDREGRPILSDGRPWPPRPAGIPDDAQFDEARGRWTWRRPALDRFWTDAGQLAEEIEYDGGFRRAVRRFDAAGAIEESCEFAPDGRRHGAFFRRLPPDQPSPYADARVRQERGRFDLGQVVGSWTLRDADGRVVRTIERGAPFTDGGQASSPAFAVGASDGLDSASVAGPNLAAGHWWTLAGALRASGRVREGLCAAARAAVRAADRDALLRWLADDVMPLEPELAAQRGEALVQSTDATVPSILDGLLSGADPASALRALAAVLPPTHPATPDFVAASLLLAPERRLTHLTRALIRFQIGDEVGARADAAVVETASPDGAASLRAYLEAAFRPYEFWPAREALTPDPALSGLPAGVTRELGEVRRVIAVFATRLGRLRAAVQAITGTDDEPVWLPPDLRALSPSGAVPLRREVLEVADAGEGGPAETVEIDEEIQIEGLGVPALLGAAQVDWAVLSWLCWSVGLDRVALPRTVAEPPLFAEAMKMIVTRCWRAQDRLSTGSLLARTNGLAGFDWQGADIDGLPLHLARVAAEEYTSVRSLFLWLASPEVLSPFQRDLRES